MRGYENEISSNLERADPNLQVARELLDKGYYDVSASRAYYAAFTSSRRAVQAPSCWGSLVLVANFSRRYEIWQRKPILHQKNGS